jgi:hypothetical protein
MLYAPDYVINSARKSRACHGPRGDLRHLGDPSLTAPAHAVTQVSTVGVTPVRAARPHRTVQQFGRQRVILSLSSLPISSSRQACALPELVEEGSDVDWPIIVTGSGLTTVGWLLYRCYRLRVRERMHTRELQAALEAARLGAMASFRPEGSTVMPPIHPAQVALDVPLQPPADPVTLPRPRRRGRRRAARPHGGRRRRRRRRRASTAGQVGRSSAGPAAAPGHQAAR